jgi:large subunit ribosomal protein L3
MREFKLDDTASYEVGQVIKADTFAEGDKVDVRAKSKGKGFQGVIKRHNQHRSKMTHGSHYHRGVGSLSACSSPSRVFKSKNMPGHMGSENVTVQNLEIVRVDVERNLLLVKGAVPGPKGGLVALTSTVK